MPRVACVEGIKARPRFSHARVDASSVFLHWFGAVLGDKTHARVVWPLKARSDRYSYELARLRPPLTCIHCQAELVEVAFELCREDLEE